VFFGEVINTVKIEDLILLVLNRIIRI